MEKGGLAPGWGEARRAMREAGPGSLQVAQWSSPQHPVRMVLGMLLAWADWGPGQPSGKYQPNRGDQPIREDQLSREDQPSRGQEPGGGDQHCLYLVGGRLGHKWADLNCLENMSFLCEMDVNQADPWHHVWPQVRRSTMMHSHALTMLH